MDKNQIIEAIKEMSVLELNELVKACEEEFGVSAAAGVVVAAAGPAEEVEEQSEFTVVLKEVGPEKIKVIKAVREITGLGLKEAKEVVDGAPSNVKEGCEKGEAEALKAQLEEVGAVIELVLIKPEIEKIPYGIFFLFAFAFSKTVRKVYT